MFGYSTAVISLAIIFVRGVALKLLLFLPLQTLHNVNCHGMAASMMDYT